MHTARTHNALIAFFGTAESLKGTGGAEAAAEMAEAEAPKAAEAAERAKEAAGRQLDVELWLARVGAVEKRALKLAQARNSGRILYGKLDGVVHFAFPEISAEICPG